MRQLDRYILSALLKPFGFFVLVFSAIIWLTQSLRVVDMVVANNQGASTFLEFSGLLLPMVFVIVLPISIFAATLYALNRLYGESELVVMMSVGLSPLSIARPVMIAGALVMAVLYVFSLWLSPLAAREYRDRSNDIKADFANSLVSEGRFSHPSNGITVYIREATRSGEMAGILIHDQRDQAGLVTYSADRAILQRSEDALNLVMFDGTIQNYDPENAQIAVLNFEKYVFDLGDVAGSSSAGRRKPQEYYLPILLNPPAAVLAETKRDASEFIAEAHEQLSSPLYALVLPLVALAMIMTGSFQRSGFGSRIAVACVLALMVRVLGLGARGAVADDPSLWPLAYLIPGLALLGSVIAIMRLNRRKRQRKPRDTEVTA